MKNFYFTFGKKHFTVEGVCMKDKWVTVEAKNKQIAKKLFVDGFLKNFMDTESSFYSSYTDDTFEPLFYPGGEFTKIKHHE